MNAADWLLEQCRGARPTLYFGSRAVSADELRDQVDQAARAAQDAVGPGEHVGILAENGLEFVAAYLGVLKAGRVAVPLPASSEAEEVQGLAARTGIRAAFCDERGAGTLAGAGVLRLWPSGGGVVSRTDVVPEELAAIMLTSGSTGEAKGVMVSHGNIMANTDDILAYMCLTGDDRAMLVLPLSYCFGLSVLHTHLRVGASVVFNNAFLFSERVLDEIETRGCSGLAGVPATYQMLLRRSSFLRRTFTSLRWLQQAGGKLADAQIREILAAHPSLRFLVMYGQTEATARLSYLPPERLRDKLGSIGRGLPSTRLEVLRPDGSAVQAGSDEIGEVVASGSGIARGYWEDAEETARYFRGGRLFTGDLARVDADGFIYLVDRARDFVKVMGIRLSPLEVEAVIAELPEIAEVAVVGLPDPDTGEALVAAIVCAGACDESKVRDHCNQRLPNVKVPKRVVVLDALPRTANGKINRASLRELVS
jgi:acyl-CoA synthetase (AMP-forming)/AMP-acid ligase II